MLCERGKDRRTGRREETEREMRGAVVTGEGEAATFSTLLVG